MSSRKDFDTKIQEDDNADPGFYSGPLSEQLVSGDCDITPESECKSTSADCEPVLLDSGLDLCLSESLSNIQISDSSVQTPHALSTPEITVSDEKSQDIPPLAFLFQQDDDGDTQLHIAAVHGCQKSVGLLIRICPEKAWLDVPNDFGQTPLHLAVLSGHPVVARMLLQAGATLGIRDCAGETPLHLAAAAGNVECLQALLAPISGQAHRRLAATINQKNFDGQTCIHQAARAGHVDALQILVFYGADINAREGLCGWTALHITAMCGDVSTARYLLEKCPAVVRSVRDYAGRTARKIARRTAAAAAFASLASQDSDSESDTDDELLYDSDQSLFDRLRDGMSAINVA